MKRLPLGREGERLFDGGFHNVIQVETLALNYFSDGCVHSKKVRHSDHAP